MPYRPSPPLRAWRGPRRALLDALASGASSEPLVEAYAVRVVAEFQGFARDLHGLGTYLLVTLASARMRHVDVLTDAMTSGRRLDAANPSVDTLTADFARLGLKALPQSLARSVAGWPGVTQDIGLLIALRNAIAHGDADAVHKVVTRGANVTVAWIGSARSRLDAVAAALDDLLWTSLHARFGREPW